MDILDLYQRLLEKGYKPDFVIDCAEDRPWYAHALRNELELDRREVFRVWYGEEPTYPEASISGGFGTSPKWQYPFGAAQSAYAHGDIEFCVDYILSSSDK